MALDAAPHPTLERECRQLCGAQAAVHALHNQLLQRLAGRVGRRADGQRGEAREAVWLLACGPARPSSAPSCQRPAQAKRLYGTGKPQQREKHAQSSQPLATRPLSRGVCARAPSPRIYAPAGCLWPSPAGALAERARSTRSSSAAAWSARGAGAATRHVALAQGPDTHPPICGPRHPSLALPPSRSCPSASHGLRRQPRLPMLPAGPLTALPARAKAQRLGHRSQLRRCPPAAARPARRKAHRPTPGTASCSPQRRYAVHASAHAHTPARPPRHLPSSVLPRPPHASTRPRLRPTRESLTTASTRPSTSSVAEGSRGPAASLAGGAEGGAKAASRRPASSSPTSSMRSEASDGRSDRSSEDSRLRGAGLPSLGRTDRIYGASAKRTAQRGRVEQVAWLRTADVSGMGCRHGAAEQGAPGEVH
jgi:hypothetical protein